MNKNTKSILLYLGIVFLLTYAIEIGAYQFNISYNSVTFYAVMVGVMWFPALAVWLTKLRMKEKVRFGLQSDIYFGAAEGKRGKYYIAAIVAPIVCVMAANSLIYLLYPEKFDFHNLSVKTVLSMVVLSIGTGVIYSFVEALGEEIGWRGFLMPRLQKRMETAPMLLISGIIWGLWHTPLVCQGHNFGTDYYLAPLGGIIMMCIFCIFYGAWCYYLYVRSKSIFVCAFAHGLYNTCCNGLELIGIKEDMTGDLNLFKIRCILMLPAMLLGVWAFYKLLRLEKIEKQMDAVHAV